MSDKDTAPFFKFKLRHAHLVNTYVLEVVVKVAQVADCTRSYTQMNWEKLFATASAALSIQLKSKDSCARNTNIGYASSSCCISLLSTILTWI